MAPTDVPVWLIEAADLALVLGIAIALVRKVREKKPTIEEVK